MSIYIVYCDRISELKKSYYLQANTDVFSEDIAYIASNYAHKNWLKINISKHYGYNFGNNIYLFEQYINKLAAELLPDHKYLSTIALELSVFQYLNQKLDLSLDNYNLAIDIIKKIKSYAIYRPDYLNKSSSNILQMHLNIYKEVIKSYAIYDLINKLEYSKDLKLSNKILIIFLASTIAPPCLYFVQLLGKIIDVRLIIVGHSKKYYLESTTNLLLSSFASSRSELISQISEIDTDGIEYFFSANKNENILESIQTAIINNNSSSIILDDSDDSLIISNSNSIIQELELLKQFIVKALKEDPSLKPSDILVCLPNISMHYRLINYVFDSDDGTYVPYTIIRLNNNKLNNMMELINSLHDYDYSSASILKFLEHVYIYEYLELQAEELEFIKLSLDLHSSGLESLARLASNISYTWCSDAHELESWNNRHALNIRTRLSDRHVILFEKLLQLLEAIAELYTHTEALDLIAKIQALLATILEFNSNEYAECSTLLGRVLDEVNASKLEYLNPCILALLISRFSVKFSGGLYLDSHICFSELNTMAGISFKLFAAINLSEDRFGAKKPLFEDYILGDIGIYDAFKSEFLDNFMAADRVYLSYNLQAGNNIYYIPDLIRYIDLNSEQGSKSLVNNHDHGLRLRLKKNDVIKYDIKHINNIEDLVKLELISKLVQILTNTDRYYLYIVVGIRRPWLNLSTQSSTVLANKSIKYRMLDSIVYLSLTGNLHYVEDLYYSFIGKYQLINNSYIEYDWRRAVSDVKNALNSIPSLKDSIFKLVKPQAYLHDNKCICFMMDQDYEYGDISTYYDHNKTVVIFMNILGTKELLHSWISYLALRANNMISLKHIYLLDITNRYSFKSIESSKALEYLNILLDIAKLSTERPINLFMDASYEYAKHSNIEKAKIKFNTEAKSYWHMVLGRSEMDLNDEFKSLSMQVYGPLVNYII